LYKNNCASECHHYLFIFIVFNIISHILLYINVQSVTEISRKTAATRITQHFNFRLAASRAFLYFPRISLPQPIVPTFAIRFHFLQTASRVRPPRSRSAAVTFVERQNYKFLLRYNRSIQLPRWNEIFASYPRTICFLLKARAGNYDPGSDRGKRKNFPPVCAQIIFRR